jgi:DUF1365 family protein
MKSAIYVGQVRHRRFAPVEHSFRYGLYMMYLDLDELPTLFDRFLLWSARRPALAWFRRADHLGDAKQSLADSVRDLVATGTGRRPTGPIRLLTHLRYFGYGFNPASFYYCFDADDTHVETIVAEVNNTPWGEQHCYVLHAGLDQGRRPGRKRYRFDKRFHVSPFMQMDIHYDWRFNDPNAHLAIHMENRRRDGDAGEKVFDATMTMGRQEISAATLAAILLRFPLMTVRVIGAIYWQALRLWLKRAPFHTHPDIKVPKEAKQS